VVIGIFDPYLDSLSGGEKYMLSIASCLSDQNKVSIFWDPQFEAEIKRKAKDKLGIDLEKVKFTKNIFSREISTPSRLLDSKKFDLIIFLSDGSIPSVTTKLMVHFQFPVEWVKYDLKSKFKLSRVSKIICNSEFTKSFIDKKFKVNSKVLYPPCNIKNTQGKKENMILHVGRFGTNLEGKNFKKQDIMIDAFKKLKTDKWRFVIIIGVMDKQLDDLQSLKTKAEGYPIEIIENPDNRTLWNYYGKAKIYWHASGFGEDLEKHPEYAEHFGISTVEAMGAGAVPVVINAGGQKEIVENGKSGFLWNTIDELSERTSSLIKDQSLWTKMSNEAIERSKKFTGDRFCKEIEEIVR